MDDEHVEERQRSPELPGLVQDRQRAKAGPDQQVLGVGALFCTRENVGFEMCQPQRCHAAESKAPAEWVDFYRRPG